MPYLLVLLVAAAVGAAVYFVTLRTGDDQEGSESAALSGAGASGPGSGYVPVGAISTDWQTRMTGLLGLVIMVIVGAVLLAGSVYLGFSLLFHLIGNAASNGGATPSP
jgi:flagellar basal body-associated protein FliL